MARIPTAQLPSDMSPMMQNNLHRAIFNNPPMAELFCSLAKGVHLTSNIAHRIRELAILRIASMLQAEVEWAQHFKVAQMVGVTAEEARAIRDGRFSSFTPAEQAAIAFAEAVETRRVTDAVWAEAQRHFSQLELLDLVMIAGFYGYASRITMALDVQVDAGLTRIAES